MPLTGTPKSLRTGNGPDEGFLSLLSRVASTRTTHSTQRHHQASFHLSMRLSIMRKTETQITLNPTHTHKHAHTATPDTSLSSLTPTSYVTHCFFYPSYSPVDDLSNLTNWAPWAYSAKSNAALVPLARHSSAPVRSHSRLACLLKMELSGNLNLPSQWDDWKLLLKDLTPPSQK